MTQTIWKWITFSDCRTKSHAVPASLRGRLLADLADRKVSIEHKIAPCPEVWMDTGGMMATDRPYEHFKIYGIDVVIPSEDCATFLLRIRDLPARSFGLRDRDAYYKLHDWRMCVVMRPLHKVDLELQIKQRLDVAERHALAFYAHRKAPSEVLREVAARQSGLPIEKIPDLGGHTQAERFRPRHRGQA